MKSLSAIVAGFLSIGKTTKTPRYLYQVERADFALGGGRRGVVPPQGKQP
jgi:hypothetical protein